jgi:hypothetical protein
LVLNKIKKISAWEILIIFKKSNYLAKSSMILALSSSPRKSFATTLPDASRIKVAGIDCTLYCAAIGSSQNFRLET